MGRNLHPALAASRRAPMCSGARPLTRYDLVTVVLVAIVFVIMACAFWPRRGVRARARYRSVAVRRLAAEAGPRESAAEPDECYIVGPDQSRDRPDLVIEVVWTSGGIDKLEIYRRLGIGEAWFWREGRIRVWLLREGQYEGSKRSALLPDLDLELLCSLLDRPTALQAVKALREHLRPSPQ